MEEEGFPSKRGSPQTESGKYTAKPSNDAIPLEEVDPNRKILYDVLWYCHTFN